MTHEVGLLVAPRLPSWNGCLAAGAWGDDNNNKFCFTTTMYRCSKMFAEFKSYTKD